MQAQKGIEKEAETEKRRALIEATKSSEVNSIEMEKMVKEKEARQRIATIEDEMHMARQRAFADATYYSAMKEAEANKLKYTPEYIQVPALHSIANNTKMFFGERIPQMFMDKMGVAGELAK